MDIFSKIQLTKIMKRSQFQSSSVDSVKDLSIDLNDWYQLMVKLKKELKYAELHQRNWNNQHIAES